MSKFENRWTLCSLTRELRANTLSNCKLQPTCTERDKEAKSHFHFHFRSNTLGKKTGNNQSLFKDEFGRERWIWLSLKNNFDFCMNVSDSDAVTAGIIDVWTHKEAQQLLKEQLYIVVSLNFAFQSKQTPYCQTPTALNSLPCESNMDSGLDCFVDTIFK